MSAILRPGGGGAGPVGAAPSLPCQNINNSIQTRPYRWRRSVDSGGVKILIDHHETHWVQGEETGVYEALFPGEVLKAANRKRAFLLRQHVNAFVSYWGREHSLFFTTTDAEGITPKVYARRWNSLLANEGKWLAGFVRVLEPQRNGRPHFHNLTAVEWDTKPDAFNWEAFEKAQASYREKDWAAFRANRALYVQSAAPELRELWAWSRAVMPRYGLGRAEILPIRKEGAISEYIGKYLDKGMAVKVDAWKGVRRFETDRRTSVHWKTCGSKFSWYSPGAIKWRARLRDIAFALGLDPDSGDISTITRRLGPRWAYRMRGAILTADGEEWRRVCEYLAIEAGTVKATVEYDNGDNAAW